MGSGTLSPVNSTSWPVTLTRASDEIGLVVVPVLTSIVSTSFMTSSLFSGGATVDCMNCWIATAVSDVSLVAMASARVVTPLLVGPNSVVTVAT